MAAGDILLGDALEVKAGLSPKFGSGICQTRDLK